jgi:alkylation response protein AidB-like acyl-CoA dehydrogenase
MAKYKIDFEDVYFNLFQQLKVQENSYGLGEGDLKDIIGQINKFVENEIWPTRTEGDEHGVHLTKDGVKVPPSFHQANKGFYENGWFSVGMPEEFGGMPMPEAVSTFFTSILCGANVSFSMYPGLTKSAARCLLEVADDKMKQKFIPKIMSGEWGGTMCLTESGAGSDVGNLRTTAEPMPDGRFKIKGEKIFISSGENDLYQNIIHLVLARTPKGEKGTKGISLFAVPRLQIKADGSVGKSNDVKCTKIEEKMGLHGQATCVLSFGESGECYGELVGKEFDGMANMFVMMNEARLLCGVQGEGQGAMAYELTKQYVKERTQFGTEIINHPDVKRMMLKMRAYVRGLRSVVLYTGNLFDLEKKVPGSSMDEINLLTPVCKALCSEGGFEIAVDAIQVHGGYGYCREYGIEQYARDIKIATIYEGTNGIQAIDFMMRKIMKDKGKVFYAVGTKISASLKTDEARLFNDERNLIIANQKLIDEIMKKFGLKISQNKMNDVLEHATDFLHFCGNLMVAWRLLEGACEANREFSKGTPTPERKAFLDSKVVDFKIYCQHYLVKNFAIAKSILDFEHNFHQMEFI